MKTNLFAAHTFADAREQGSVRNLEPLRDAGLSDRGMHDLVAVVAYFNFVNRMASGLGVELEAAHQHDADAPV